MSSLKRRLLSDYENPIIDPHFGDLLATPDLKYDLEEDSATSAQSPSPPRDSFEDFVGPLVASESGGADGSEDEAVDAALKELDLDVFKRRFWILAIFSYEAFLAVSTSGPFGLVHSGMVSFLL